MALLTIGTTVAQSDPAYAGGCFPWWCCDDAGYNWPENFAWKSSCTDAGGNVSCNQCSAQPNNPLQVYKCCDSDGAPVSGVYTRSGCVAAGYTIFEQTLTCPNSGPFQCCDPVLGGNAPRLLPYIFRTECIEDGYVVQDFTLNGCPGGWIDDIKDAWNELKGNVTECAPETYKHYKTPTGSSLMDGWKVAYEAAHSDNDPDTDLVSEKFTDKHEHCVLSCLITYECGKAAAYAVGWARETIQMCDGSPKNSWGWGDACANRRGRQFGEDLAASANFETECLTYCNETIDVDAECEGLLGGAPQVVQNVAGISIEVFQGVFNGIGGLFTSTENAWDLIAAKCEWCSNNPSECIDLIFGLTLEDPGELARSITDMRTQGLALIAALGPLVEGDLRVTDGGAIIEKQGADDVMILVNNAMAETDTYLSFTGQRLDSVRVRGATGANLIMTAADPVTTACAVQPCETRVPWVQWLVSRTSIAPVQP